MTGSSRVVPGAEDRKSRHVCASTPYRRRLNGFTIKPFSDTWPGVPSMCVVSF